MISNAELQRLLAAQPLFRMQQFARHLGWRGLQLRYHRFEDDPSQSVLNRVVFWYETSDWKFCLMINPRPQGQCRHFEANVQAERYGMPTVGWQEFELFDDDDALAQEAVRLMPWHARRQFKDRNWRRRLLAAHPDLASLRPDRRCPPHPPFV